MFWKKPTPVNYCFTLCPSSLPADKPPVPPNQVSLLLRAHSEMLRSFASVVGELGLVSDPDLNFNSLKKHAVFHSQLSK